MPIINTNQFWNYIINEPIYMINECKTVLTFKEYNFDTKSYDTSIFYQEISKFNVDGIIYETLRFPGGLTKHLAEKTGIAVENQNTYDKIELKSIYELAEKIKLINPNYEIRDYQVEAVQTSLEQYRSLITMATGSGKTSVMCLLCEYIKNYKILILNNNNFILTQIYDRLKSFGEENVSWNPSKEPDYSKRIVLFNTASSNIRLCKQDENYLKFLNEVETIIWDEAHGVQAITFFEPLFYTNPEKLKHIIGYTGTPFREYKRPYTNSKDFCLISLLGEPSYQYNMKDSIQDENIAQPYVYFIRYKNKIPFIPEQYKDSYYMQYRASITYNKARNTAGIEMLKFLDKHNIKTMASLNNIKFGQKVLKELTENGVKCLFICGDETIYEWKQGKRKGSLKLDKRSGNVETIKTALRNEYNIIFSSQVFDAGVDIDIFQAVLLWSGNKETIPYLQRIGRGTRKKVNGMNVSLAIDFKDVGGLYTFEDHYLKRKKLMEDSGIKILADVHDFIKLVEDIENAKEE